MKKERKNSLKPEKKSKKAIIDQHENYQCENKFGKISYKLYINKLTKIFAIISILTAIIVSYFSYVRYKIIIDRIENEVSVSANQVENVFIDYSNISEMLLMHLYHQMLMNDDIFRVNVKIAKILTTFNQDTKIINSLGNNLISGAMFYWIDSRKNLIASSSGLVSKAINLSSRDYLQKTEKNPMHIQIGSPVIGALSGKSIIPMALGINNLDGDFAGSIVLSLQLENFLQKFRNLKERNIEFAILDDNKQIIMSSSEEFFKNNHQLYDDYSSQKSGEIIHSYSLFNLSSHVIFAKDIENQPYKVLTVMRSKNAFKLLSREMLPSFIELMLIILFIIAVKITYSYYIIKNK